VERRRRFEPFADAAAVLDELSRSRRLALVTNGAACLQREKLAACGLEAYFDVVVVSADVGVAKPGAEIFEHVLTRLNADGGVMIGDSLDRDVEGAIAAGLGAVWLNRDGAEGQPSRPDVTEIATLAELPGALARLGD
jgi:putative hydrolase of the HAD superfamily